MCILERFLNRQRRAGGQYIPQCCHNKITNSMLGTDVSQAKKLS